MTLAADIATLDADTLILHQIVHGNSSTSVTTEGGVVPTVAKMLATLTTGNARGAWAATTVYSLNDIVTNGGSSYRAVVAHTSGTVFAVDNAAGKWAVLPLASVGAWAGDGTTDDTAAIQQAIDSGEPVVLPPGTFKITNALIFGSGELRLSGSGRALTTILVPASFYATSPTALGALVFSVGAPGPFVSDLTIRCDQVDTSSRGSMTPFPPAIYAVGIDRFTLERIRISGGWRTGIDMTGNAGGSSITDLELTALDYGIKINGALDSVKISRLHAYPFTLTTNQTTAFLDGTARSLQVLACDDLHLESSLFYGQALQLDGGFGDFTNCDFDTSAEVKSAGGIWNFAACFFSSAGSSPWFTSKTSSPSTIENTGELAFVACTFLGNDVTAMTGPGILVEGKPSANDVITVHLHACNFRWNGYNGTSRTSPEQILISLINVQFTVVGCRFFPQDRGVANTVPIISVTSASRGAIQSCIGMDWGSNARTFAAIEAGSYVSLRNTMPGYQVDFTGATLADILNGDVGGNTLGLGLEKAASSPVLTGAPRVLVYTGTCTGGGVAQVTHALGSTLPQFVQRVDAGYKGPSGEWKPLAVSYVDGTVIYAADAAAASKKYRIFLTITGYQDAW